ncbi:MAG: hypothetical protein JXR10_18330, partial [Cyclobacteriaceae bacterium]
NNDDFTNAANQVDDANVFDAADAAVANGTAGASKINNLDSGTYYLVIASNTNGCPTTDNTQIHEFFIDNNNVKPTVQVTQTAQDETCDDGAFTPTGQATANAISGGVAQTVGDYIFTWYESNQTDLLGTTTTTATFNGGGNNTAGANVVDSLPQGTYYVRITDNLSPNLGCASSPLQAVTITQFEPTYSIGTDAADFTLTNATDCDPINGGYEVLRVSESNPDGSTTPNTTLTDRMKIMMT